MRIPDFLTMDITLERMLWWLPDARRSQVEEVVDVAYCTVILNAAVLLIALIFADPFDLIDRISFGSFALGLAAVSLPVWCLTFGVWRWAVIRERSARRRRRLARESPPVESGSAGLWDEWLDGPRTHGS